MNRRKLQRAKGLQKASNRSQDMIMTHKASQMVDNALVKDPKVDCIGNFILFSTVSGDAWMLDHRGNRALKLAEKGQALSYRIIETKEKFSIEWKERFRIEDDNFIATRNNEEKIYPEYPTKTLSSLIDSLK